MLFSKYIDQKCICNSLLYHHRHHLLPISSHYIFYLLSPPPPCIRANVMLFLICETLLLTTWSCRTGTNRFMQKIIKNSDFRWVYTGMLQNRKHHSIGLKGDLDVLGVMNAVHPAAQRRMPVHALWFILWCLFQAAWGVEMRLGWLRCLRWDGLMLIKRGRPNPISKCNKNRTWSRFYDWIKHQRAQLAHWQIWSCSDRLLFMCSKCLNNAIPFLVMVFVHPGNATQDL